MSNKQQSSSVNVLSEEDSKLLSAYLDGELKPAKSAEVAERLETGEEALVGEYERLKETRSAAREWHRTLGRDEQGEAKQVDLWSRIEGSIAEDYLVSGPSFLHKLTDAIVDFFGSPALGPAFAGVLLVLYLGLTQTAPEVEDGDTFASSPVSTSDMRPVSVAGSRALSTQEPTYIAYQRELERLRLRSARSRELGHRRSPLVIPVVPVLERDFAQGGLRSHGADIDWIRANRDFNLYHSKDRSDPPVIWVARGRANPTSVGIGR